jgi:hypothetical protein
MRRHFLHITLAILALTFAATGLSAQRIGFGISFGEGVDVQNLGDGNGSLNLDFNEWARPRAIIVGDTRTPVVEIRPGVNAGGVIRLRITAPADADVTVTVTSPVNLDLDGNPTLGTLPVRIGWGYWNTGDATNAAVPSELVTAAREVASVLGTTPSFTSATFPMTRRTGAAGPPSAPPDPRYVGREPAVEMAVAYLTVYGSIPNVPANAKVGVYTGEVDIHVELSTYAAGGTP